MHRAEAGIHLCQKPSLVLGTVIQSFTGHTMELLGLERISNYDCPIRASVFPYWGWSSSFYYVVRTFIYDLAPSVKSGALMIGTVDRVHEGVDYPGINVASMACVQRNHECKCCEKFHFNRLNFRIVKESLLGFNLALV